MTRGSRFKLSSHAEIRKDKSEGIINYNLYIPYNNRQLIFFVKTAEDAHFDKFIQETIYGFIYAPRILNINKGRDSGFR